MKNITTNHTGGAANSLLEPLWLVAVSLGFLLILHPIHESNLPKLPKNAWIGIFKPKMENHLSSYNLLITNL